MSAIYEYSLESTGTLGEYRLGEAVEAEGCETLDDVRDAIRDANDGDVEFLSDDAAAALYPAIHNRPSNSVVVAYMVDGGEPVGCLIENEAWLDADLFHVSALASDCDIESISTLDMRDEIASALAAGKPVEYGHGPSPRSANAVVVVYFPEIGRGGICSGSGTQWSDATDWRDLIDRYNGVKPWCN